MRVRAHGGACAHLSSYAHVCAGVLRHVYVCVVAMVVVSVLDNIRYYEFMLCQVMHPTDEEMQICGTESHVKGPFVFRVLTPLHKVCMDHCSQCFSSNTQVAMTASRKHRVPQNPYKHKYLECITSELVRSQ